MAFFTETEAAIKPKGFQSRLPKCEACKLYKSCQSPKMEIDGQGRKGILIVGEAPGKREDERGRPFVGPSGKYLAETLLSLGIDMRRDCWLYNAAICRPRNNATPTPHQIDHCRPNVLREIKKLKPKVIILLGGAAVASVIGATWKESPGGISRWAGWRIPNREPNAWICPTFNPSFVLRSVENRNGEVVQVLFRKQLKQAIKKKNHPWREIPDESKEIEIIYSPNKAAKIIRQELKGGGLSAFDYETNMLRPDEPISEIVSCSICFRGERTIAYPWTEKTAEATTEYLHSDMGKLGANIKFEQRWTVAQLGIKVKNWKWDSMQAAHVLDQRPGITSVKFQAYLNLGLSPYDGHIKPYLISKGTNKPNRIRELDLDSLLQYNGMDALIEYKLGILQSQKMGIEL